MSYEFRGAPSYGVELADGTLIDVPEAATAAGIALPGSGQPLHDATPSSLLAFIAGGEHSMRLLGVALHHVTTRKVPAARRALDEVTLVAPIPRPAKNVFCVGRNYVEHVKEGYKTRGVAAALPEHPQFFTKAPTTVIGPGAAFYLDPDLTQEVDHEVELGVVIGKRGVNIKDKDALDHVFGYTIINDITARDLQRRHDQWFKGKSLDRSCPMGPWIVDKATLGDPQTLSIALSVNGETRQQSNTDAMIFSVAHIIASLSAGLTLEPGDVIACGTPSGVGYAMEPPRFLRVGDRIEASIGGIGSLQTVIAGADQEKRP